MASNLADHPHRTSLVNAMEPLRTPTIVIIGLAVLLSLSIGANAGLQIPSNNGNNLWVLDGSAGADMDHRKAVIAIGCEEIEVEVTWEFDGITAAAWFTAWIDGGTTEETGELYTASSGSLWPTGTICLGESIEYGGEACLRTSAGAEACASDAASVNSV